MNRLLAVGLCMTLFGSWGVGAQELAKPKAPAMPGVTNTPTPGWLRDLALPRPEVGSHPAPTATQDLDLQKIQEASAKLKAEAGLEDSHESTGLNGLKVGAGPGCKREEKLKALSEAIANGTVLSLEEVIQNTKDTTVTLNGGIYRYDGIELSGLTIRWAEELQLHPMIYFSNDIRFKGMNLIGLDVVIRGQQSFQGNGSLTKSCLVNGKPEEERS